MERYFDQQFGDLQNAIKAMGRDVEEAIQLAIEGLTERSTDTLQRVHDVEKRINQHHILVDETCMRVLARQAPMASSLRLVLGCIKVNADLERMGDQAVNIAYAGMRYLSEEPLKPLVDLPKMADDVRRMTRDALDAFFHQNEAVARQVLKDDDQVDAYKNSIFRELIEIMKRDPQSIDRAMDLILVSRNLERIGDHATNIAEDVIFVASGVDIRHGKSSS